jgi:hypothetical protein
MPMIHNLHSDPKFDTKEHIKKNNSSIARIRAKDKQKGRLTCENSIHLEKASISQIEKQRAAV